MDIHNLNENLFRESNSEVLNQLLHSCADEVCGYPGPSYQQFANNMDWSKEDYGAAYKLLSKILTTPSALYLDTNKMPQEYHELRESVQKAVMRCLEVRQKQLTEALLMRCSKKQGPTLRDFDWRLKMVMGSSKVASLREPLLQLDLAVEDSSEDRVVAVELNREELDSVIEALESIEP